MYFIQTAIVPCSERVVPQSFTDEEELERLAGLQQRDSLVRGLGVSEQLQSMISSESKPSSRAPSALPLESSHNSTAPFSAGYFTEQLYGNPSIDAVYSRSSASSELIASEPHILMTSTDATPLTTMPGLMFHHLSSRRPQHSYTNAASKYMYQATTSHSAGFKYTHGNRYVLCIN